ncbi:MAG: DUF4838 domain-containing protein [Clostridia bacterium]|nr:DUF4838 domain-containing protein [Clostridia bacterium]
MFEKKLRLASHGKSAYAIYLPGDAAPAEHFAAEEFRNFFAESTGVELPTVSTPYGTHREYLICIGTPPAARPSEVTFDRSELSEEEIVIRTSGGRVLLCGGSPRGTLYAVYQFLEDYLGIRWFSPDCTRVPKKDTLEIPEIDYRYNPVFRYRNCFVFTALNDPLWVMRNRLNACGFAPNPVLDPYGGPSGHAPAGHSFWNLIPPEEYFDEHPEYFSLVNGERVKNRQICLSNPDVFRICKDKLRERLRTTNAIGVDVAQNDCLGACECENCRKIDEKYNAFSGSILTFLNRLAEELSVEFPDKLLQTYAYQYGQTAPTGLEAHKNVAVWLCSIEACFAHPHGTCDTVRRELRNPDGRNPFFPRDIVDWGKITDNLFVWNYDTNFRCFLMPHPNLHVLGPNLRFFRDHGVKGVFEQNCTTSAHTEMQELRAYILAKCLWNPDYDDRTALEEFCDAYWGMAASPIRQYIDMLRDTVMNRENDMHMFLSTMPPNPNNLQDYICASITRSAYEKCLAEGKEPPTHGICKFMTEENIRRAEELFDRAERLADNADILERVQIARMPLRYYEISTLPDSDPERMAKINAFFADCSRFGIAELKEGQNMTRCYDAAVTSFGMY